MKELDSKQLIEVLGGATVIARRRTDAQLNFAVTRMASDLRYAARQRQRQMAMAPMMMVAVIAGSQMA